MNKNWKMLWRMTFIRKSNKSKLTITPVQHSSSEEVITPILLLKHYNNLIKIYILQIYLAVPSESRAFLNRLMMIMNC